MARYQRRLPRLAGPSVSTGKPARIRPSIRPGTSLTRLPGAAIYSARGWKRCRWKCRNADRDRRIMRESAAGIEADLERELGHDELAQLRQLLVALSGAAFVRE
jgi:hypothetical protein